tara:strand:+ start:11516 stop:11659 length:144 start_codon:yes stop_codon:yes gene_type:complete
MLVLDIAEWIANIFILGIAALIWIISIFILMLLASLVTERIKDYLVK